MLVELYLGDVPEMAGHSVATLGRKTTCLLLCSPGRELFQLVELYLRNSLEMAGHLAVRLGETLLDSGKLCTVTVKSYSGLEIYVFVWNLKKYLYYREQLYDCTRKYI